MAAYRCSQCGTNWPNTTEYRKCPSCGIATWYSNSDPLSKDDAARVVNYALFEQYAREWEIRRAVEEENEITETKEVAKPSGDCALCGKPMGGRWCPHPWGQPFDQWPDSLRAHVIEAAPKGYDPENTR